MNTDKAQMLEGCRRGDRRMQKALYEAFAPMVMGVCMRYAHDRDAAQDLLQDSFVRVFEHLGQVREAQRLDGWIYRTAVNVCTRDYHRRQQSPVDYGIEGDSVVLPLDPFGVDQVVQALQQIAPAQRLVFNLVEVEGYSYAEAAKELHCTEVNLRALLCRAKSELRKILTGKR